MIQELLHAPEEDMGVFPAEVVETAAETVADALSSLNPAEQAEIIEVANEELAIAGLALVRVPGVLDGRGSQTKRSRDQIIHEALVTHKAPNLSKYANRRVREAKQRLEF